MTQFLSLPYSTPSTQTDLTAETPTVGSSFAYLSINGKTDANFKIDTNGLIFGNAGTGGRVLAVNPTDPLGPDYTFSITAIALNYVIASGDFLGVVLRAPGTTGATGGYAVGVKCNTDNGSGTITGVLGCWDLADPTLATPIGTPVAVSFQGGSSGNPSGANQTLTAGIAGHVITASFAGTSFTVTDSTYTAKGVSAIYYVGGGTNMNSGWVWLSADGESSAAPQSSGTITAGTLSLYYASPSELIFTLTTDTGGTSPYANQLMRSPHGANTFTAVGSPVSSTPQPGVLTVLPDTSGTPGTAYDYKVNVTDSASGTGQSNTISPTWPNDSAGVITVTGTTSTTISLSATEASGGTPPFTHQWSRTTVSGSTSTVLTGQTGLTLTDTGLTPSTTYHYTLEYADSGSPPVYVSTIATAITAAAPSVTPLAAGTATTGTTTSTTAAATATDASGGTSPYSYQWYRSTTSGSLGAAVVGQTTLTLADTGLTASTFYFYTLKYTDSASTPATATTNQITLTTAASTGGSNPVTLDQLNAALATAFAAHDPWATVLPGSYTNDQAGSILGGNVDYDGIAQGGTSNTIQLEADETTDALYRTIVIVSGTGEGQARTINSYVGSTKVAGVDRPWTIIPDSTTKYVMGITTTGFALSAAGVTAVQTGLSTSGGGSNVTVDSQGRVTLAPAGMDAVMIEAGINARQSLSLILASDAGSITGVGTGTITINGANTTITRITAGKDNAGDRINVVLTPPN